ncbi:GntR family transcriptional regulator [Enterococcus columbae]|uniref:HTH gntR-type domain-containing protein n=1 Tax=Enterococcus columbae DSM 7374 = ATCC 51263 TaxID=1121865 RepID=S1NQ13_9ENTE|nr:GntR family transcriptional regulator [Enterococcus columbae]EOT38541.1 hypothetical protein OMW_02181 [Enterococcus columbae DSM 7374 = ATCC 51263]EOW87808.1 hypothetical protein I568_00094 [Enterococcus columbae DSM 7374 = ATCC 51263]OJG22656.1 hypothetical protein RR47_GL000750 [Enterococcus columbae DSM 7374 = ATCC 51263]
MVKTSGYRKIANDIMNKIQRGTFRPGEKLPKQTELADFYETSRVTVQKALNVLTLEGYIASKKGVGTFVKNQADENSLYESDATEPIGLSQKANGRQAVTSKVVSFHVRTPEDEECEKLAIRPVDNVYDIIRVRYLDNQPFRIEYTVIPVGALPELNTAVLENSLYQYVEKATGQAVGSAIRKIKADMSDRYDQKYLDCQLFDPVLEIEQVVTFADGRPFELSEIRYRYDKGCFIAIHSV